MILATGIAELVVPGREEGKVFEKFPENADFLRLEFARDGSCGSSANWPKMRPVVAAATADPVPTSCFYVRNEYLRKVYAIIRLLK